MVVRTVVPVGPTGRYRETMLRVWRAGLALLMTALVMASAIPAAAGRPRPTVLVYTAGPSDPRFDTVEVQVSLLEMTGRRYGIDFRSDSDPAVFDSTTLPGYDVVMFLGTDDRALDDGQRDALQRWVTGGGGFIGVHDAARTGTDWAFYRDLVGAFVDRPDRAPTVSRDVLVRTENAVTAGMPATWEDQTDQWYTFDRDPAALPDTEVLASVRIWTEHDPDPIVWSRRVDEGYSLYIGLGHTVRAFQDGDFMRLVRGGVWWAGGVEGQPLVDDADAAPPWPYLPTFILLIVAVAAGGAIAVVRLNRVESAAV